MKEHRNQGDLIKYEEMLKHDKILKEEKLSLHKTGENMNGGGIRCKKCRIILGYLKNIIPHGVYCKLKKNCTTQNNSRKKKEYSESTGIEHMIVDGMHWIPYITKDDSKGTIYCRRNSCKNKIGKWNWNGMKCGCCGKFISPAFTLIPSKVDTNGISLSS